MRVLRTGTIACALLLVCGQAQARERHHRQQFRGVNHHLVAVINAKLRRWVRPRGHCGSGRMVLATIYGNGDGQLGHGVACGGRLHAHDLTVAHRTWPCGTELQITNPINGRSSRAVVRDRGPATIAGIDLGVGVAHAIGMHTSIYVCVSRE